MQVGADLGKFYDKHEDFSKLIPTISMKVFSHGVKMSRIKILKARGPEKFYGPRSTAFNIFEMTRIAFSALEVIRLKGNSTSRMVQIFLGRSSGKSVIAQDLCVRLTRDQFFCIP